MPRNEEPAHDPSATGALRSLFGRRRKSAPANDATDPALSAQKKFTSQGKTSFFTSAALGCELLNRLSARMAEELKISGALEEAWTAEMMRRPRADLLRIEQGALSAANFDRYVAAAGGIDKSLVTIHEETMGALRGAARIMAARVRELRGEQGRAWVQETLAPCIDHADVTWPVEFPARAWAQSFND